MIKINLYQGLSQTVFWKTYPIADFRILVRNRDRFLEKTTKYALDLHRGVFQKSVSVWPQNSKIVDCIVQKLAWLMTRKTEISEKLLDKFSWIYQG